MAFHRTDLDNEWAFVRGPARLLAADDDQTFPTEIDDIVKLASGVTQFDAQTGWTDLGATKGGVQVSTNHTEETFDVDQVLADIDSAPTAWEASVSTALAENTLEHFQLGWEGSAITTNTSTTSGIDERTMGYGNPTTYVRRKLAVLYQGGGPDRDLIRAFVFRRVQLQPVESAVTFNKTGEQISIPVNFKSLADTSVADVKSRFFVIIEQTAGP